MKKIIGKVHAHMPYHLIPRYLESILKQRLNLEIYFHHWVLRDLDKVKCVETAKMFADNGLKITFHAPFLDLRPAALDDEIRKTSLERIKQVFDLVPYFHPLKIVCHPSFDDRYYVSADDLWLENSVKTWTELIKMAKDYPTTIALENVYEKNPYILRRLFDTLSSGKICFCFDTGHFNVFSHEPLEVWLKELGKYMGHLHLHDNFGKLDEHLPVGNGTFPFEKFFQILKRIKAKPTITLEAHNPDTFLQSVKNFKEMKYL